MSFSTTSSLKASKYRLVKNDGLPKAMTLLEWHALLRAAPPENRVGGFAKWSEDEVRLTFWLGSEGVAVAVPLDCVGNVLALFSTQDQDFIQRHITDVQGI